MRDAAQPRLDRGDRLGGGVPGGCGALGGGVAGGQCPLAHRLAGRLGALTDHFPGGLRPLRSSLASGAEAFPGPLGAAFEVIDHAGSVHRPNSAVFSSWKRYMWDLKEDSCAIASRMKRVRCPNCNVEETKVKESRRAEEGASVRRRRECSSCGHRFTTYERYERGPLYVRKRDGERQPFDRAKLRGGLARAAHKRPDRRV